MKLFLKDRVPSNYNRATWVDIISQVERQVNDLSEGRVSAYHGQATAAPTTGSWVRGDWQKNSLPSPSGWFGWICVESGTPGTWKQFGLIDIN